MGTVSSEMSVTLAAVMAAILLSFILFLMEFIICSHSILFLFTMVLMMLGPLLGLQVNMFSIILMIVFQITFVVANMTNSRSGKNMFSMKNRVKTAGKSTLAMGVIILSAIIISLPFVNLFEDSLYNSVYQADAYIQNISNKILSNSDNNFIDGQINRGNLYQTGESKLLVTAYSEPTEKLYLQGFNGADYTGGQWSAVDETAVIDRIIDEKLSYSNSYYFMDYYRYSLINNMYFLFNKDIINTTSYFDGGLDEITVETKAIRLNIKHINNDYSSLYIPYYAENSNYNYLGIGIAYGYDNIYYNQKDVNIDLIHLPEISEFQNLYYNDIKELYTKVPEESLPRLSKLCSETPLTELDEITTYILYTLNSCADYTVSPGMAPFNKDIVEHFLFDNGKGYCVHFASAAALMYRMYGIPARYVSGYVIEPSDFIHQGSGVYEANVTDKSAHSWVEIFIDGYGWTPVEVTPASDGSIAATYPGFDKAEMKQIMDKYGWSLTSTGSENTVGNNNGTSENENQSSEFTGFEPYHNLIVIIITVAVCAVLSMPVFIDYRRLRRLRKLEKVNCRKIFGLMIDMLHFSGVLKEYDGTEEDFAKKLSEIVINVSESEVSKMIEIVTEAAYGQTAPKKADQGFVRNMYKRISAFIYNQLKWQKKLIFRYIKAFI